MLDFFKISQRTVKKDVVEIYPKFLCKPSKDLMIRSGDFYAVWNQEKQLWCTDEYELTELIDKALDDFVEKHADTIEGSARVLYMWDSDSGSIDRWHKYCQKQCRDNFHMLDEKLIFSNMSCTKEDYASKRLSYPLEKGSHDSWDKLISTLYSPEERTKIEWAIGAVVSGDSKTIQKFLVFYGEPGTGKSTILNIVQKLFKGYYASFDSKALGSASNQFALEAFTKNPLIAIQHDGDLSKIEDNTRLNSLVSHESMSVNVKFKSAYEAQFKTFLFMGTNKPVRITDAKSGILRRLIDVTPTGNKLSQEEYDICQRNIDFELGAIAYHCLEVYNENKNLYRNYIPIRMMAASNDFYNFVADRYFELSQESYVSLTRAYEMYEDYCEKSKAFQISRRLFGEELKNYYETFHDRYTLPDGTRVRSVYTGFKKDKFYDDTIEAPKEEKPESWLKLNQTVSILDHICANNQAQYGDENEKPYYKWDNVKTVLSDLDTHRLHYMRMPDISHVVVDFDLKDADGNKSLDLNMKEAAKWRPTYAELSKGGCGIHLHYIYDGDPNMLESLYAKDIEIKVFTGKQSLRRRLSLCNDLEIAHINSGLPLKREEKMVEFKVLANEKAIRTIIAKNLRKEYHASTKCSIDFIYETLENAYNSGMNYDVSDMETAVTAFACQSTHQADYCINKVVDMKFRSENPALASSNADDDRLVFYDVEVFPNLFVVCWKYEGDNAPLQKMVNPTPNEIELLIRHKLVGFNCRKYDNHILWGRMMGYTNKQLYNLSVDIIQNKKGFFSEAYNLSYTDILDFSALKQSLKKFEIDLGIHHQELGLPWDQPVREHMWNLVAEYCFNDVIATEATFKARKADFIAREILADVAGMTVNDTTNTLTTAIIFEGRKHPQSEFNYRNMAGEPSDDILPYVIRDGKKYEFSDDPYFVFNQHGQPIFSGYQYNFGKSTYREFNPTNEDKLYREVGEGGCVYSEPGIYSNVALLDIASMHPSSIVAENLFGDYYTARFKEIIDARIAIKHKDFDTARKLLGGKLAKYLDDESAAKDLAQALKIAINSVYGLTAASFDNAFRDKRNIDNIVAKRGALFMINLKNAVQARGFTVAHIKTDSIKIPNATPEIIQFVMDYGKAYGYNFEHEATYEKMCLVNKSVYIAKYKDGGWTATGTQFQVPYVFKTLFSREPIEFADKCESKQVTTALYLDMNENLPEDTHDYYFIGRIGLFCPIKPGCGGGDLRRESVGKDGGLVYTYPPGCKGYRWLEAETVKNKELEHLIDESYYQKLVDDAIKDISVYAEKAGMTFEEFAS